MWATSKHDAYLMHSYSVMHWSSLTHKGTEVLNVAGPVIPIPEVFSCMCNQKLKVTMLSVSLFMNCQVALDEKAWGVFTKCCMSLKINNIELSLLLRILYDVASLMTSFCG